MGTPGGRINDGDVWRPFQRPHGEEPTPVQLHKGGGKEVFSAGLADWVGHLQSPLIQIPAATTLSLHTHYCYLHYTHTILMEQIQDHQVELPLLPSPPHTRTHVVAVHTVNCNSSNDAVSLDLQLSISSTPTPAAATPASSEAFGMGWYRGNVESMKRHAAEQIRLAAADKAYAERVRELTRREKEAAESEFARAKHVWERAHHEMEVAQLMKDKATTRVDPSCLEITCQSCRLRFRP